MTRKVKIGKVTIGGGSPIAVQSMTNTKTADVKATVEQIKRLEDTGCGIIRCGIPDMESAIALEAIKRKISIPLVADIHYDYKLAIQALRSGADKIRINPGNIGSEEKVIAVIREAKKHKAAIRIGVNSGSLKQNPAFKLSSTSGNKKADLMVASLMEYIEFFEKEKFFRLVLSLKASDVPTTIDAYKLIAKYRDYCFTKA
jgi:(E)-4-hydroxy-3-methylbut-2-enyl-diphosphate synthase